jgi:hypothetical protein
MPNGRFKIYRKGGDRLTDIILLETLIKQSGLRRNYIAEQIGVTPFTFAKKLRNESEFKASEIHKLCEILQIKSAWLMEAIFFPPKVDYKSTINRHLLAVWTFMLARCYDPRHDGYRYYGEKGVTVCDEWREDFLTFHDWAKANGYKEGLTLDRIDPTGNYEPDNCRWTTWDVQAKNKRSKD